MIEENTQSNKGVKKHRSPNYPFIGLSEAVDRARSIQAEGGIHFVPFIAAMDAWNYKAGTTNSVIAALKAYGLIDVTGEGDKRSIRVTEVARKILDDHSDTPRLLKEAALAPPLYSELWVKYGPSLPPSDKVISEYLKFERNFNPSVVDGIIKDFRATIAFSSLGNSDNIVEMDDPVDVTSDDSDGGIGDNGETGGTKGTKTPPPLKDGVMYNINIEVLDGGQINVTTAGELNPRTFTLVSDIFKIKEKHEAKASDDDSEDKKNDGSM